MKKHFEDTDDCDSGSDESVYSSDGSASDDDEVNQTLKKLAKKLAPIEDSQSDSTDGEKPNTFYKKEKFYFLDFLKKYKNENYSSVRKAAKDMREDAQKVIAFEIGGKFKVISKKNDSELFSYKSKRDFKEYTEFKVWITTSKGKKKKKQESVQVPIVNIVLDELIEELSFSKTHWFPYTPLKPDIDKSAFNMFQQFQATLMGKPPCEDNEIIKTFKSHLFTVWAAGDSLVSEHMLDWLASILQNPTKKTRVVIVLYSQQQQIGKNILTDFIKKYIFGNLVKSINDLTTITRDFNSHITNKLMLVVDEAPANKEHFHANWDKLKSKITEEDDTIERKGADAEDCKSYTNYLITTNNADSIKIEKDDERYFVCECDARYKNNYDYFNFFDSVMSNQEAGDIVYTYLMNRDISKVRLQNFPQTNIKSQMQELSLPKPLIFLKEFKETKHNKFITNLELYGHYQRWCDENGIGVKEKLDNLKFQNRIARELGPSTIKHVRNKKSGVSTNQRGRFFE
jgi:hypothetical protein